MPWEVWSHNAGKDCSHHSSFELLQWGPFYWFLPHHEHHENPSLERWCITCGKLGTASLSDHSFFGWWRSGAHYRGAIVTITYLNSPTVKVYSSRLYWIENHGHIITMLIPCMSTSKIPIIIFAKALFLCPTLLVGVKSEDLSNSKSSGSDFPILSMSDWRMSWASSIIAGISLSSLLPSSQSENCVIHSWRHRTIASYRRNYWHLMVMKGKGRGFLHY